MVIGKEGGREEGGGEKGGRKGREMYIGGREAWL